MVRGVCSMAKVKWRRLSPPPHLRLGPSSLHMRTSRPAQPELALGEERVARKGADQFGGPDLALLIARLTVIRENLKEAIEAV